MPNIKRNFQNILLLLGLITLNSSYTLAKKGRAADFFPPGSGMKLNSDPSKLDEELGKQDQLVFLYVFDSSGDRSTQMNNMIMHPLLDEMKHYCSWYAFDCNDEDIKASKRFNVCENPEHTPFFQLMKPPELKLNPYTKQPMKMESIPFNEREVTLQKVKSFILSNLPDYSTKIETIAQLEAFADNKDDLEVNKVILFSNKTKTPPIYKALTTYFRDRVRFAFVQAENKDIVALYKEDGIGEKFPSILVLKSFDIDANSTIDKIEKILYKKKDIKFEELKDFFNQYARYGKKEALESAKQSSSSSSSSEEESETKTSSKKDRRAKKPYAELYDYRQFNSKILEQEKAALVFYITSQNVTQDVQLFDKIFAAVNGPLNVGVFYINQSAPDYQEVYNKLKLGKKFPQLRFYKNNLFGEDKNAKSFEIYIKKLAQITEEIHENIDHDVKEVSEKIFNNLAVSSAVEEKKNVIVYFYNDERMSLHFKALSGVKYLHDDFVFMSVFDPSQEMLQQFQIQQLPAVAGILKALGDDTTQARQFTYGGPISYEDILKNLLHLEGKEDDYQQKVKLQSKTRDRKFEEITNQYKFQQNCLDKGKGCAIAFLSGNSQQDYEVRNHKEYLETLEQLEKDAKSLPLYYMWVNASCHSYMLEKFEITPMFIPTVIFYLPEKDRSAHLIGKFDKETIQKHEQKFVNGKLATFPMKTKSTDLQFQDLDCPNIQLELGLQEETVEGNSELDDEILKEILEEEKEREKQLKKQRKAEQGDKKKKKKKSTKTKKEDL
eukprot:403372372